MANCLVSTIKSNGEEFENFELQLHILISCIKILPEFDIRRALILTDEVLCNLKDSLSCIGNTKDGMNCLEDNFNSEVISINGVESCKVLDSHDAGRTCQKLVDYDFKESAIADDIEGTSNHDMIIERDPVPLNFQAMKNMQYMYQYCATLDPQSEVILNLCSKSKNELESSSPQKVMNHCSEAETFDNSDSMKSVIKSCTNYSNISENMEKDFNDFMTPSESIYKTSTTNILYNEVFNRDNENISECIHIYNKLPQNNLSQMKDSDSYMSDIGVILNLKKNSADEGIILSYKSTLDETIEASSDSTTDEALNLVRNESIKTDCLTTLKEISTSTLEIWPDINTNKREMFVSCKKCQCELLNESSWIKHYSQCFKSEELQWTGSHCPYCDKIITSKTLQKKHIESHLRNTCTNCESTFPRRKHLQAHMKSIHGIKTTNDKFFKCDYCSRMFSKKTSLYYHLQSHSTADESVCQKCGDFITGKMKFEEHMKKHIEKSSFQCDICQMIFLRSQQYHKHMKGHKEYICKYCNLSLSNKKMLFYHYKEQHPTQQQLVTLNNTYSCDLCPKVFIRPSLLRSHKLMHSGISLYSCTDCNIMFSHKTILQKHFKSMVHKLAISKSAKNKFTCDHCASTFSTLTLLKIHCYEIHLTVPSLKCKLCDFKTNKKKDLLTHRRTIHMEKPPRKCTCEICGNSFGCLATLKEHFTFLHSDERRFKCSKCDKTFKKKSCLVRHNRCHSNDRPYKCECGAAYKQLFHLVRHQTSAHSGKSNKPKKLDIEMIDQQLPIQEITEKDFMLASDTAVLIDNNGSESTPLFTVLDSQFIQLIPSSLNVHHEGTVSLVGNELHTLSIASLGQEETFSSETLIMQSNDAEVLSTGEINSSVDASIVKLESTNCLQLPSIVDDGSNLQFSSPLEILQFDTTSNSHNYLS